MNLRIGLLCNESERLRGGRRVPRRRRPDRGRAHRLGHEGGPPTPRRRSGTGRSIVDDPLRVRPRIHGDAAPPRTERSTSSSREGPERVLELCIGLPPGPDALRAKEILETAHRFASEGMRVLAMAYKEAPADLEELTHEHVEGNLTLTGLQGMIDPPAARGGGRGEGLQEGGHPRRHDHRRPRRPRLRPSARMIGIGDGTGGRCSRAGSSRRWATTSCSTRVQDRVDLRPRGAAPQAADRQAAHPARRDRGRDRRRRERRAGAQGRAHRGRHGQDRHGRGQGGRRTWSITDDNFATHLRAVRGRPDRVRQHPEGRLLPDPHGRRRDRSRSSARSLLGHSHALHAVAAALDQPRDERAPGRWRSPSSRASRSVRRPAAAGPRRRG